MRVKFCSYKYKEEDYDISVGISVDLTKLEHRVQVDVSARVPFDPQKEPQKISGAFLAGLTDSRTAHKNLLQRRGYQKIQQYLGLEMRLTP